MLNILFIFLQISTVRAANSLPAVFHLKGESNCTGFMVSNTCAVSAGHCLSSLETAVFNAYDDGNSMPQGDFFEVDRNSIQTSFDQGDGDWAVFNVSPRNNRALMPRRRRLMIPGIEFGKLDVEFTQNYYSGQEIFFHGYGRRNNIITDVKRDGYIVGYNPTGLGVVVPYTIMAHIEFVNGDSGAPIIDSETGRVIGIAVSSTIAGVDRPEGSLNLIAGHESLKEAIRSCIENDR